MQQSRAHIVKIPNIGQIFIVGTPAWQSFTRTTATKVHTGSWCEQCVNSEHTSCCNEPVLICTMICADTEKDQWCHHFNEIQVAHRARHVVIDSSFSPDVSTVSTDVMDPWVARVTRL